MEEAFDGIQIDRDTGYCAFAVELPKNPELAGAMHVAVAILNWKYASKQIRDIGGAYSYSVTIEDDNIILCTTSSDPSPCISSRKFRECGKALRSLLVTDFDVKRYIKVALADLKIQRCGNTVSPIQLFWNDKIIEESQLLIKQIRKTTRRKLLRVADMLDKQMPLSHSMVAGGRKQLKGIPAERIYHFME